MSLDAQASHTKPLYELHAWMLEHLDRPLSVDALAERVAMSPRNFARLFAQEFGTTPGHYLKHLRVEAARRLLEQTDRGLMQVASASGFGSADVMRRVFRRVLGTTPLRYRRDVQALTARSSVRSATPRRPLTLAQRAVARAARVALAAGRHVPSNLMASLGSSTP